MDENDNSEKTDLEKFFSWTNNYENPKDKIFQYVVAKQNTGFIILFLSINLYYVINNNITDSYKLFMTYTAIYGLIYSVIMIINSHRMAQLVSDKLHASTKHVDGKYESLYNSLPLIVVGLLYITQRLLP